MAEQARQPTGADWLVRRLYDYGVRHVFGYPGGPLTPLYDALYREPGIRHVLARDEQAAAFMADGYARATGRPGVCFAVCGPGVYNAATPLATSYSDSVPVLLIGGQLTTRARGGARSGYYHENDELAACSHFTKWQVSLNDGRSIVADLDRAWVRLTEGRPGPVFIDAPANVMYAPTDPGPLAPLPTPPAPRPPRDTDVAALIRLLTSWEKPLLMAGGGVVTAGAEAELRELAERLGAPVFHTFMGKGALPAGHPLLAGTPWKESTSDASDMASRMSPLFAAADGLLAVGCRFTQVITGSWALKPPPLAQIDVDLDEIGRHYPVALGVCADARETLRAVLAVMPEERRPAWAPPQPPRQPRRIGGLDLLTPLSRALPDDAIIAADVTQLAYSMLVDYPVKAPRTFLHPAAFIAMGYGLPAALGAKAAFPDRTVVAVMGDGCFQMTGFELATAVQEDLPVVVVLVNDSTLTLIKLIQQRRYEGRYLGVDLRNPDFGMLAKAFGVPYWSAATEADFTTALHAAVASRGPALVEVQVSATA